MTYKIFKDGEIGFFLDLLPTGRENRKNLKQIISAEDKKDVLRFLPY